MLAAAQNQIAAAPTVRLESFRGSSDTLETMRKHVWGPRGEQSGLVRQMTEEVVAGIRPKDYLSEILAIRNFATSHVRYVNDPLHVEYIKDPQRMVEEIRATGMTSADCDEIASLIATMALQLGRQAEFVVVGFGAPGQYSHVFARVKEPKTGKWIVTDPVAGSDERTMLSRVKTYEIWSLDE